MPVANQGRGGHLQIHGPEQRLVQLCLIGGHQVRRGRGQPDHVGMIKPADHGVQQAAPQLEQVVAFVQDQGQRAGSAESLDQRAAVGMQEVERVAGLSCGVDCAERLVGQHGERGRQLAAGCRLDSDRSEARSPLCEPLRLDRGVGAQHDRRPRQPASRLQSDQRLPAARRNDQVRALIAAGIGQLSQGVLLMWPQSDREVRGAERVPGVHSNLDLTVSRLGHDQPSAG